MADAHWYTAKLGGWLMPYGRGPWTNAKCQPSEKGSVPASKMMHRQVTESERKPPASAPNGERHAVHGALVVVLALDIASDRGTLQRAFDAHKAAIAAAREASTTHDLRASRNAVDAYEEAIDACALDVLAEVRKADGNARKALDVLDAAREAVQKAFARAVEAVRKGADTVREASSDAVFDAARRAEEKSDREATRAALDDALDNYDIAVNAKRRRNQSLLRRRLSRPLVAIEDDSDAYHAAVEASVEALDAYDSILDDADDLGAALDTAGDALDHALDAAHQTAVMDAATNALAEAQKSVNALYGARAEAALKVLDAYYAVFDASGTTYDVRQPRLVT